MKKAIAAAAAALMLSAGAAAAATVSVSGTPGTKSGNDFDSFLPDSFVENAILTITGPVRLTFTLVGAESGYRNTFSWGGSAPGSITEANQSWGIYGTGTSDFSIADLASLLFTSSAGVSAAQGAPGFGVYFAGTDSSALTSFFLAYDDQGVLGGSDDNHDDHLVMVTVAAVPLPAAGFMLLAGLGGLAAFRRLRRSA